MRRAIKFYFLLSRIYKKSVLVLIIYNNIVARKKNNKINRLKAYSYNSYFSIKTNFFFTQILKIKENKLKY